MNGGTAFGTICLLISLVITISWWEVLDSNIRELCIYLMLSYLVLIPLLTKAFKSKKLTKYKLARIIQNYGNIVISADGKVLELMTTKHLDKRAWWVISELYKYYSIKII